MGLGYHPVLADNHILILKAGLLKQQPQLAGYSSGTCYLLINTGKPRWGNRLTAGQQGQGLVGINSGKTSLGAGRKRGQRLLSRRWGQGLVSANS